MTVTNQLGNVANGIDILKAIAVALDYVEVTRGDIANYYT